MKTIFRTSYANFFKAVKGTHSPIFCHNLKTVNPIKLVFITLELGFKGLKLCCFEKNLIRARKPSKMDSNKLFLKILISVYLTPAHGKICNSNTVTPNRLLFIALEPELIDLKLSCFDRNLVQTAIYLKLGLK